MTYEQAIRLLDRVKDGQNFPLPAINLALELTGDIDETTARNHFQHEWTSAQEVLQVRSDACA